MLLLYAGGMQKSIVIDATHLGNSQPTGVERYTTEILPRLSEKLVAANSPVTWIGHTPECPISLPQGVQWLQSPHIPGWSQRILPKVLKTLNPYLFFTPSGVVPLRSSLRTAMVVHDMGVYRSPESYPLSQRLRLGVLSRYAAKHASLIIVPSEYTASEVQHFWPHFKGSLRVVPHGYEASHVTPEPVSGMASVPLFLYVGRIEKKKNLIPVVQGFARLFPEHDAQLVLAGKPGYGASNLKRCIAKLPQDVQNRIHILDYISEGQKAWLYQYAAAGIVPCPIEGFGFPALDCFNFGVLALCAQAGALPEVAADAALYVQPESATDWFLHLRDISAGVVDRESFQTKGRKYLKRFTWELAAEATATALLAL
jgi:glycosyltransferase involved in cell wall biosynthesis